MASGTGSHQTRISPRKFSEKIALLNKNERETNKNFEEIIKEVQATRQQQHSQQPDVQQSLDSISGAAILQDELHLIGNSNYRAVHAESLDEIEKVYENLMESVGQCDVESQENSLYPRVYNGNDIGIKSVYNPTNAPVGKQQPATIPMSTVDSPFIPSLPLSTATFYQQSDNRNLINTLQTDLSGNHQHRRLMVDSPVEPCKSVAEDSFSGHNQLDVCVPNSCESTQSQDSFMQHPGYEYSPAQPTACRARVVSFGSASRQKYPCATSDLLNQQDGSLQSRQHAHHPENQNYHTQYLKEPSGERSRQKSCSDPQLHISPSQHMIVHPVVQCSSENRLANHQLQSGAEFSLSHHPQATMECCDNHHQAQSQQQSTDAVQYKLAYNEASLLAKNSKPLDIDGGQLTQEATRVNAQSNLIGSPGYCQSQPPQDHQYHGMCGANSSRSPLPGIKICTIDDDPSSKSIGIMERASRNRHPNESSPPSRDGSLPDIANLRFGTNSSNASPERDIVVQKQYQHQSQQQPYWPGDNASIPGADTSDTNNVGGNLSKFSCQFPNVGWSSYDEARADNVAMDIQDGQLLYSNSHQQEPNQDPHNQTIPSRCWQTVDAQQAFAHPLAPKVNNTLSNSDCGFTTAALHPQQGSLMICASSDFYNNIIRSRSHNNISSMNHHSKQSQHYPCNALQQIEQHHTSQYCLQTDQQPAPMNVRRIAELKAYGTSTSPLDSSSNLNSPQSEMNSPGSSTTEQCETAAMIPANVPVQHQEDRQFSGCALANDSNSTLIPDGLQFVAQYTASAVSMPAQGQGQPSTDVTAFVQDVCNQPHR